MASRINYDKSIDPDFGSISPSEAMAFVVSVDRKGRGDNFSFIVMVPGDTEKPDVVPLLTAVCDLLVEEGDQYEVREYDEEQHKWDSSTPLVSFHPRRPDEYYWLCPPTFMRN